MEGGGANGTLMTGVDLPIGIKGYFFSIESKGGQMML